MITYKDISKGDILKVVTAVDVDFENADKSVTKVSLAEGDLVKVIDAFSDGVKVETEKEGDTIEFYKEEGALHLEKTEFKGEFPEEKKARVKSEAVAEETRQKKAEQDKKDAEKAEKEAAKK